jgi:ferritin-like metal-binding protein YciE
MAGMTKREQLIQWLGDAHAMEVGIVSTLEKHIADAKGQPKVRAALSKHLGETKRHATTMKQALASLGGSHPIFKEGVSKLANLAAGLVTTVAKDTPVKNAIADFATEHFEIACYSSLIATATLLGEKKIATACKAILKEEQAMAKTLAGQLVEINTAYLAGLDDGEEEGADEKPAATAKAGTARTNRSARGKKTAATRSKRSS